MLSRRGLQRLLAVAMVLTVVALASEAVAHWHNSASDEVRCQVCHVGHAAAPGPSAPVATQTPVPVARFTPTVEVTPDLVSLRAPSIPRAPPA
jgi:hypothetical protein